MNQSDIKAEFEAMQQELSELRQQVLTLTEIVQGVNTELRNVLQLIPTNV
jgi:hypothetical protein